MPRRAPHFLLRKENGGKEPRGERRAAPLRTPFLRPAADPPFSRAAGRLTRPFGRKPPADGETLEKPRSKAQLFKRFCAKGDACALLPISPFFSLLAGLAALRAANRRLAGKRPKCQGAELSFSGVSVRGGTFDPAFYIFMEIWRGLCPASFLPATGTGARFFPCLGEQEPCAGHTPGNNRGRARHGNETNTGRDLLTAGVLGAAAQARFFGTMERKRAWGE